MMFLQSCLLGLLAFAPLSAAKDAIDGHGRGKSPYVAVKNRPVARGMPLPNTTTMDWPFDWESIPVEPASSTIAIDSNLATLCDHSSGLPCWNFLIDTTQVCSFVTDPAMNCTGNTEAKARCHPSPDLAKHPDFIFLTKTTIEGSPQGTCFYPQRKTEVGGLYSYSVSILGLGEDDLVVPKIMIANKYTSSSLFYKGWDDFAGDSKDKPVGVLGFGEYADIETFTRLTAVNPLLDAIYGGSIPMFSVVTPRGNDMGKLVVGGVPNPKGENPYSTKGVLLRSLDLPGSKVPVYGGNSSLNLPYAAMNKPYAVKVSRFFGSLFTDPDGIDRYVIDSMSPVIRTQRYLADYIATAFDPPATKKEGDPNWYVDCSAKVKKGTNLTISFNDGASETAGDQMTEVDFPSWSGDLIVPLPGDIMGEKKAQNKVCVSAVQEMLKGDVARLGRPFLRNVMVAVEFRGNDTMIRLHPRDARK
jgi:hypothetical protein